MPKLSHMQDYDRKQYDRVVTLVENPEPTRKHFNAVRDLLIGAPGEVVDYMLGNLNLQPLRMAHSAYWYEQEMAWARQVQYAWDREAELNKILLECRPWALSTEMQVAVGVGKYVIAFAGSGPFPATAALLHRAGHTVHCIDRDPVALSASQEVFGQFQESHNLDVRDLDYPFTNIVVCPALLGVDGSPSKTELIKHLAEKAPKVIVREPHGWGRLFYHSLDDSQLKGFDIKRLVPPKDEIYRSGTTIVTKKR